MVDLAFDGVTATGRWRVLGMPLRRFSHLGRLFLPLRLREAGRKLEDQDAGCAAGSGGGYDRAGCSPPRRRYVDTSPVRFNLHTRLTAGSTTAGRHFAAWCHFRIPTAAVGNPHRFRRYQFGADPNIQRPAADLVQRARASKTSSRCRTCRMLRLLPRRGP